jgi:hypothetical protein
MEIQSLIPYVNEETGLWLKTLDKEQLVNLFNNAFLLKDIIILKDRIIKDCISKDIIILKSENINNNTNNNPNNNPNAVSSSDDDLLSSSVSNNNVESYPNICSTIDKAKTIENSMETSIKEYYPVTKGKLGEDTFLEICKELPVNYKVINTSKETKKGDFNIIYTDNNLSYNCLVEIKNYKNVVKTDEISKFLRDISYGYDCGIFISFNSGITGIKQPIYFDEHVTSLGIIPIVYISNIDILYKTIIIECIKLIMIKNITKTEKEYNSDKIMQAVNYINISLKFASSIRNNMFELKHKIDVDINNCVSSLSDLEINIKTAIRNILNTDEVFSIEVNDDEVLEINDKDIHLYNEFRMLKEKYKLSLIVKPFKTKTKITCEKIEDFIELKPYFIYSKKYKIYCADLTKKFIESCIEIYDR